MKRRQFFIPNVAYWRWERVNPQFVKQMYLRSRESYEDMENAIAQLDGELLVIGQEFRGIFATANANAMWSIRDRIREVQSERKRIVNMQARLVGVMDRLRAHMDAKKAINA